MSERFNPCPIQKLSAREEMLGWGGLMTASIIVGVSLAIYKEHILSSGDTLDPLQTFLAYNTGGMPNAMVMAYGGEFGIRRATGKKGHLPMIGGFLFATTAYILLETFGLPLPTAPAPIHNPIIVADPLDIPMEIVGAVAGLGVVSLRDKIVKH